MLTHEQIKNLAAKFHIDQFSILREYFQLIFLKYFYAFKESERIYFKGGTAIHFLYGSFRFSEDLDFTCSLNSRDLKHLLDKTMEQVGIEIPDLALSHLPSKADSINALLKYHRELKHPLTIRLQFSLREKPLTFELGAIETVFPVSPYPLVVHLSGPELLAEKVRALSTRSKGRDLFDLWFLLTINIEINKGYIQKKMAWYKRVYHPKDLLKRVQDFSQKELDIDLGKFLPKNYRPFIKNFKTELLTKLKTLI